MFEGKLNAFSELPVREKDRKCTDCLCTAVGSIFALTMFILAFVFMNKNNYYKSNFPTDSDGEPCSYGVNSQYSYVYFPDINDPTTRVCVSSCPQATDMEIQCRPNKKVPNCLSVNIQSTSSQFSRLGGFCAPTNEADRDKLITNANLNKKWEFLNTFDVTWISLIIALLIGLIWMAFIQCLPKAGAVAAMVLGSLILLLAGILLLVDNAHGWEGSGPWRIIIGVFLILFALMFFFMIFLYRRRIKITGTLLLHAGKFLASKPINFAYIPLFLGFSVGLIFLCLFQYLAYASHSNPYMQQGDIYLKLKTNPVLTAFTIIQFIWGLQFFKDTFNFFISGNTAEWYINGNRASNCCTPVARYFKFNFGSVVGGSFLNGFFNFIDFLFESFRCYPEGGCGVCAPLCTSFSKCCGCFFDLVRNDAYTYINLTGIPYCDAARNCEALCSSSSLFIGSQSVMFFYRLCAHTFCIGLTTLLAYWMMKAKNGGIDVWSLILIMILVYCIVTYLIDIHADAAEALQISYLTELELGGGNPDNLAADYQGLKGEMKGLFNSYDDGKC